MPITRDLQQEQLFLTNEFGKFIDKRLKTIRPMTSEEMQDFGWDDRSSDIPFVMIFDGGMAMIPSQDPEGNGPGWVFTASVIVKDK